MGYLIARSEDGTKHAVFKSQEEFFKALLTDELDFVPTVKNQNFSGIDDTDIIYNLDIENENYSDDDSNPKSNIDRILTKQAYEAFGYNFDEFHGDSEDNTDDEDNFWRTKMIKVNFENCTFKDIRLSVGLDASFNHCRIDNLVAGGDNHNLRINDSEIKRLYSEFSDINLTAENSNFDRLGMNECSLIMDTKKCNFENNNIWKTHISGQMTSGTFNIEGKTWPGQYGDLTMTNIDFGPEKVDETYFYDRKYHDPLELVNCRNAGKLLNKERNGELVVSGQCDNVPQMQKSR